MLSRILEVAEENNMYLRRIYRAQWWRAAWTIFYWTVIILMTFGAYYVVQPYLDVIVEGFAKTKAQVQGVQAVGEGLRDVVQGLSL